MARRVAAARAIADLTQDQLARRLTRITGDQWTKTTVGRLEQGRKIIPAGLLFHLGEALGQRPEWFVTIPGSLKELVAREPQGGRRPPVDPPPHHR